MEREEWDKGKLEEKEKKKIYEEGKRTGNIQKGERR